MNGRLVTKMHDEVVPEGAADETRVREIKEPGFISGEKSLMRDDENGGSPRCENLWVKETA